MSETGFRGFDRTIQDTNTWLRQISEAMNHPSRQVAYHALRGVLFALRDRLTVDEVFDLSAQLPMLVRGIFFEGYRAAGKPEKYHLKEFIERVNKELQTAGGANPEKAARGVLKVMIENLSGGEMDEIRNSLPEDLRSLWPQEVGA